MTELVVTVDKPRPDFRVFVDLMYGPDRNVDTEGDAINVWSRDWRELYIRDREHDTPRVEIYAAPEQPLKFAVISDDAELAELVALYLYLSCGAVIERNGHAFSAEEILRLKKKYTDEVTRAANSIWHQSGIDNPFPNLAPGQS
ncbi:hypothetical protein HY29_17600 [Hyphomonas beringensis]|uniref:Uncharacterized protein n=1 Tax=Hyphomonas beringensis TaxID=1280946 RepID=A0A062U4J0_9PROT|nr:hypothetical protein [Hyphomonas beringensis]KCZ53182.1 hypothetical protein HY29_17600 [Hyphomonas beringensis]